jgi:N-acetyl-gamma-glutamyl-phosphate reductase
MYKIFIDGQAGTTGLQIHQRLRDRTDIEILQISAEQRKDVDAKASIIDAADVVILCLPDEAALETVALAETMDTRFIDASTAHRTNPDWVYGLAELNKDQRTRIIDARLVTNPGCYPTGFLLAVMPLVEQSLLKSSSLITISALSGYSGGGRQMMEKYKQQEADSNECPANARLWHSRPYALNLAHKHIPEMQHYAGLDSAPLFLPSVGHFPQGMLVSTGLFKEFFTTAIKPHQVFDVLDARYKDEPCIQVYGPDDRTQYEDGFLHPEANNGTNRLDIFVSGHDEQILLVSRLDNLGKGAAGAAIQNLNLMLGAPELQGLIT